MKKLVRNQMQILSLSLLALVAFLATGCSSSVSGSGGSTDGASQVGTASAAGSVGLTVGMGRGPGYKSPTQSSLFKSLFRSPASTAGNASSLVFQLDPLSNSQPGTADMEMANPYDGTLWERYQSSGTWNAWQQIIVANSSGQVELPSGNVILDYADGTTGLMLQANDGLDHLTLWNGPQNQVNLVNQNAVLNLGANGATILSLNKNVATLNGSETITGGAAIAGNAAIGGNATVTGIVTTTSVTLTSDQRLKTDIQPLAGELENILKLRPVTYKWNSLAKERGIHDNDKQLGFIAQEIEKIFPEAVKTAEDKYKSVNYPALISPLTQAFKEFYAKWTDDHAQLESLKRKNAELEKRLDRLEKQLTKNMQVSK